MQAETCEIRGRVLPQGTRAKRSRWQRMTKHGMTHSRPEPKCFASRMGVGRWWCGAASTVIAQITGLSCSECCVQLQLMTCHRMASMDGSSCRMDPWVAMLHLQLPSSPALYIHPYVSTVPRN